MSKIAVVFWSQTGNTEAMSDLIAKGAKDAGGDVSLFRVSDVTPADALSYDALVLGCPSMGVEVLEEDEFEPFFTELEKSLSGKKVALFGSYGWGDGEWMRDWEERTKKAGASLLAEGLIVCGAPEGEDADRCVALGASVAKQA